MPSSLLTPFDLETSPLEVAPDSGLEDYADEDDAQFLVDNDQIEALTIAGLRISSLLRVANSVDDHIKGFGHPELMPKKVAAFYVAELKKIKPSPEVTVRKAEGTLPVHAGTWDFGVYVVLDLKFEDETIGIGFKLNVALGDNNEEASGNAKADQPYGLLATKRGRKAIDVARMLVTDVREHLTAVKR